MPRLRKIGIVGLLLTVMSVRAIDSVTLTIAEIEAEGWRLEGVEVALTDIDAKSQAVVLSARKLTLPEPFDTFEFAEIRCVDFSWGNDEIECRNGRGEIRSERFESPRFNFSFHIGQNSSELRIDDLKIGGGTLAATAETKGEQWSVRIRSRGLQSGLAKLFIDPADFQIGAGSADIVLDAEGKASGLDRIEGHIRLAGASGQTTDGSIAGESIDAAVSLKAGFESGDWKWFGRGEINSGAIYIEPFYLEIPDESIVFNSAGRFYAASNKADIVHFSVSHPGVFDISASGMIGLAPKLAVEHGRIFLNADNLKAVSDAYFGPLVSGTWLEGLSVSGRLGGDLALQDNMPTEFVLDFSDLSLNDDQSRFGLQHGIGSMHWSNRIGSAKPSIFAWQQFQADGLPIGPSKLSFITEAKSFRLLNKTRLPIAGGALSIDRFEWSADGGNDHDLFFTGSIESVSLESLSEALGWTPLSGTISGTIPGLDYRNNKLTLDGELKIDVFDGEITISKLASIGLFSDFSQVYADIEIDGLDLYRLTNRFEFGGIEGRLSGFVRDLYLENWQPVNFFAWLGTPENDDSKHRISQKAVDNLASIGGGGATDLVSRTFLGFFDTFGYDKLGIGCYLNNGVCQLTGVDPAEQGYYIVKGGGLPRIDVMGYNPRVDWHVLLERLKRVTATDDVVIE